MWGDMSLWNVQGPLLHSGDHIVPRILTVDYTFKSVMNVCWLMCATVIMGHVKNDLQRPDEHFKSQVKFSVFAVAKYTIFCLSLIFNVYPALFQRCGH